MKKMIIVSIISVVLLLSVGAFFVVNRTNSDTSIPMDDSYLREQVDNQEENLINTEDDNVGISGGASGSGGGSGGGETISPSLVCINKKIKYSLKNFNENINCLENELGKCIKLSAICSVDVYNIDEDVESNFTIEYALVDTADNDLDTIQIERNVNVSTYVRFNSNFTVEDSGGIDVLSKCTPRILSVPEKEVCS